MGRAEAHLVPPGRLGLIEGSIRLPDQVFYLGHSRREASRPGTDREMTFRPRLFHGRRAYALGLHRGLGEVGLRQDDGKLLSAVARSRIHPAGILAEDLGQAAQRLIARQMPVAVIVLLEV